MTNRIPFNKPFFSGKELIHIAESVQAGHYSGDGPFTLKCQKLMEKKFGAKKILLTHSCTAALEMAALLCEVGNRDEIILPSFTFVSTATAFQQRGAKLVFTDIRPDTLNIDEKKISEAITSNTKIIVPVHYAGIGCDMGEIMRLAKKNSIYVVEDAAHCVNAKYDGQYLGTIGDIGTYSFHETKKLICGEGGAIVINNKKFVERAEIIRDKGTNRKKFLRGEVDRYTWVDTGSSYLPSDILAAFLFAQLEIMDQINDRNTQIFQYYYDNLLTLEWEGTIKLPFVTKEYSGNTYMFYIIVENERIRDKLMNHMDSKGISAVFHYLPLHLSPVGRSLGYSEGQLPVTESISKRLLRLPFFYELKESEKQRVVSVIKGFFGK